MATRHSAEIEEAENGHIVRVNHDTDGGPDKPRKYITKRYVAHSLPEAQRIAGSALSGKMPKRSGISEVSETPAMEAQSHPTGFLKKATKLAGKKKKAEKVPEVKSAPKKRG